MADELSEKPLTLDQLQRMREASRRALENAYDELTRLEALLVITQRHLAEVEIREKKSTNGRRAEF